MRKKETKVLYVDHLGEDGGVYLYSANIWNNIISSGYDSVFITRGYKKMPQHITLPRVIVVSKYRGVSIPRSIEKLVNILLVVKVLRDEFYMEKNKRQIIHINIYEPSLASFIYLKLVRIFTSARVVVTFHDLEILSDRVNRSGDFFMRRICKECVGIITHSNLSLNIISQRGDFKGISHYIPIPDFLTTIRANILKTAANENNSKLFDFALLGRLKPTKGVDIALEAFAEVVKQKPTSRLLLAGNASPDMRSKIESNISRLMLAGSVFWDDRNLSDSDLFNYMFNTRCVILPYKRAFGSGILSRAAELKKATIVSDISGLSDGLVDNLHTLLVAPSVSKELVEAMIKLLKDPDLRYRLGDALHHKLGPSALSDRIASVFNEFYENL